MAGETASLGAAVGDSVGFCNDVEADRCDMISQVCEDGTAKISNNGIYGDMANEELDSTLAGGVMGFDFVNTIISNVESTLGEQVNQIKNNFRQMKQLVNS